LLAPYLTMGVGTAKNNLLFAFVELFVPM